MSYQSEQEDFWSGTFGDEYINRNSSAEYFASNLSFFTQALRQIEKPEQIIEFGANVGMNIKALALLFPQVNLFGVEINRRAAEHLKKFLSKENVFVGSMFDFESTGQFDLSLVKGVLIHLNPNLLPIAYEQLYSSSRKYILICEYYSPTPVEIPYRGYANRLFKRDFAGEMLEMFNDLRLVDYGFVYHRDNVFPQDDINWFLLKKC